MKITITDSPSLSHTVAAATRIALQHGLTARVTGTSATIEVPDDHPLLALTGGTDEVEE
jgi:uncharacterized protein YqgV (UPF0045/DUF77 family)